MTPEPLSKEDEPSADQVLGPLSPSGVEAILLGIAQDGGVPQAGCRCDNCCRAWADPGHRHWVACLAMVDRAAAQAWLVDATPDFRDQLHALEQFTPSCTFAGIVLTHAHVGHYAGLIHLGREAMNTHHLAVYATTRLARFLRENVPWSQLVDHGNVELRRLAPGTVSHLTSRLRLLPIQVPHRDEWSDTLALMIHGPARRLFYCPDVDAWDQDLTEIVASADVSLLDGTFYSAGELPGRSLDEIPHPLVTDTAERFSGASSKRWLIHLNHTNPLLAPGPERRSLAAIGIRVATFGQRWPLD